MALLKFLAKRLAFAVSVVFVVTFLVFCLLDLAPGSPEETIGFGNPLLLSDESREALREDFGLNRPFLARYASFLGDAATLSFGDSYRTQEDVMGLIAERLAVTVPLVLMGCLIAYLLGGALGTLAACRRGRSTDRAAQTFAFVCLSTPVFVLGLLLLYLFAVSLGWFPVIGDGDGGLDRARHLALPALTLGLIYTAVMLKMTRAAVSEVLESDHVTFARARGTPPSRLLGQDVLRPAGVGIATACSVILIDLSASVVLIEPVFGINGLGTLLTTSIARQDIPVVQAITLLMAILVVGSTIVADLVCYLLDPRIRLGMPVLR